MDKTFKNICHCCGKERVVLRVWKEKTDSSVVETTETLCPDKKCQKTAEKEMIKQKNKLLERETRKKQSLKNRRKQI